MPAAAVIPAPLAYIKVAAVKKLVVGSRDRISSVSLGHASKGVVVFRRLRGLIRRVSGFTPGFHLPRWPAVAFGWVSLIGCPPSNVTILP